VPAPCRGANQLSQRPRDPALPSDHLADVLLRDEQPQDDEVISLLALDANRVRVVDEPTRKDFEQLRQCS
jgi:hypothetical protein